MTGKVKHMAAWVWRPIMTKEAHSRSVNVYHDRVGMATGVWRPVMTRKTCSKNMEIHYDRVGMAAGMWRFTMTRKAYSRSVKVCHDQEDIQQECEDPSWPGRHAAGLWRPIMTRKTCSRSVEQLTTMSTVRSRKRYSLTLSSHLPLCSVKDPNPGVLPLVWIIPP